MFSRLFVPKYLFERYVSYAKNYLSYVKCLWINKQLKFTMNIPESIELFTKYSYFHFVELCMEHLFNFYLAAFI